MESVDLLIMPILCLKCGVYFFFCNCNITIKSCLHITIYQSINICLGVHYDLVSYQICNRLCIWFHWFLRNIIIYRVEVKVQLGKAFALNVTNQDFFPWIPKFPKLQGIILSAVPELKSPSVAQMPPLKNITIHLALPHKLKEK